MFGSGVKYIHRLQNSIRNISTTNKLKGDDFMHEYLIAHERKMNNLLMLELEESELVSAIEENLQKMQFMQHERLVHLLVTITISILCLITFLAAYLYEKILLMPLTGLFFVLEIPYIMHYYKLENGVQRLYLIHDKLMEKRK